MADRMIVMNGGVADQIGKPLEVYGNPQTEFVGGFIGSPPMNFLNIALAKDMPTQAARLGVRPEHIQIAQTGALAHGKVLYSEALGAETLVHVKLADGSFATVRQDASLAQPEEGAQVGLAWSKADQITFDAHGHRC